MAAEPSHILHLARWYPYREDPMFGLFVQNHVKSLLPVVRCTVVFVWPLAGTKQMKRKVTESQNLTEIIITFPERRWKILNVCIFLWYAFREALPLVRKGSVDIIHVHVLTRLALIAWLFKSVYYTPYVLTEHWTRYLRKGQFKGILRKWLTRKVVKGAAHLSTVSQYTLNTLKAHGLSANANSVVGNVVDDELFQIIPTREPLYFVHVSTFDNKAKNITGMIQAFATLRDCGKGFRLLLIGDGEDFELCRKLSESLKMTELITFTGVLTGKALANAMGGAMAYVQFSNYENMPVVISESLMCGVPVISTDVGGIAEIVNEQTGILIAPGDQAALVEALQTMAAQYTTYKREHLRSVSLAKYGSQAVQSAFLDIYNRTLSRIAH